MALYQALSVCVSDLRDCPARRKTAGRCGGWQEDCDRLVLSQSTRRALVVTHACVRYLASMARSAAPLRTRNRPPPRQLQCRAPGCWFSARCLLLGPSCTQIEVKQDASCMFKLGNPFDSRTARSGAIRESPMDI